MLLQNPFPIVMAGFRRLCENQAVSDFLELLLQLLLEVVSDWAGAWATWRFYLCLTVSIALAVSTLWLCKDCDAASIYSGFVICVGVLGGVAWDALV